MFRFSSSVAIFTLLLPSCAGTPPVDLDYEVVELVPRESAIETLNQFSDGFWGQGGYSEKCYFYQDRVRMYESYALRYGPQDKYQEFSYDELTYTYRVIFQGAASHLHDLYVETKKIWYGRICTVMEATLDQGSASDPFVKGAAALESLGLMRK